MKETAEEPRDFQSDAWQVEVNCRSCGHTARVVQYRNLDFETHPEWRGVLRDESFFHWVCPSCGAEAEFSYPCRCLDPAARFSAVLNPGASERDIDKMNSALAGNGAPGFLHRIVDTFYSMQELQLICEERLDDRCVQLLKPLIIGQLQSQGREIWNAFFTHTEMPADNEKPVKGAFYISDQEGAPPYAEQLYWFRVHEADGNREAFAINQKAFDICEGLLYQNEPRADDGLFHRVDLSWAIAFHNRMQGNRE